MPPKANTSILNRAKQVTFNNTEPFSLGIFGASGSGKTTVWSSWPKPILACICSGTLKKPGELRSIPKKERAQIDMLHIENCEQLNEVAEAIPGSKYKTVVLDHLTSFSDLVLMQILGLEEIPPQLSWGFATQQDWGKHGAMVKEFLKNFINMQVYTVVVSQQRVFEPPEGSDGVAVVGPATTPTITGWLVPALDYCIQTYLREEVQTKTIPVAGKKQEVQAKTGKDEYCAYLPGTTTKMTKFRAPRGTILPQTMVNPTFDKLSKIIEGLEG